MSNITRNKRANNFTINNNLLNDNRLDWKSLGLLVYILSKPDDWKVSVKYLATQRKTKRDGVYTALREIIAAGYGTGKPNPKGGYDYQISDEPIFIQQLMENKFINGEV